ncbi:MAG: hypothetical protein E6778_23395 [Niallia nealsonii]|nr:hypothetical protein [Niallia nealsonii]
MDVFIEFINLVITGLGETLDFLFGILPDSPFLNLTTNAPEGVELGYITWFIPFPSMLVHLATFLVAVGLYYVFRIVARWLKLVRS